MKLYTILVISSLLCLHGCRSRNAIPDLRETYGFRDTRPFGAYASYNLIREGLGEASGSVSKMSFNEQYDYSDSNAIYISITKRLSFTDYDIESLLEYVSNGNTVLLSSSFLDSSLLALMQCKVSPPALNLNLLMGSLYDETHASLSPLIDPSGDIYSYYYEPVSRYFTSIRDYDSKILGYNESGKPNFVLIFYGEGRLLLHCDPRLFSNYFLLKGNENYLKNILQTTSPDLTRWVWDDHYKDLRQDEGSFSTLNEIMKHPALAAAFWIALALLILFVLFNSKRKRSIIPVQPRNENSSLAFTETIARLYLQQANNNDIVQKQFTYFKEHIRNHYFLNMQTIDNEFLVSLSKKSGVHLEDTQLLFSYFNNAESGETVTDKRLLEINDLIQKFYKKR